MKILSWNVNGIRAVLKKGFIEFINLQNPDILCIQETKAQDHQVQIELPGYEQIWNSAEKKGYSGTLIFTKIKPLTTQFGPDNEGRVIILEFEKHYLINVYTPNSGRGLPRLEYRQKWDKEFLTTLNKLQEKKPIIVCGDLNVAHNEIDLKNPQSNKTTKTKPGNAGFTDQERKGFQNFINSNYIDTFREFNKEPDNYTWWSYMFNSRAKNVGWRIDYFLISPELRPNLKDAFILPEVMGSDHCPVGIKITSK